MKVNVEAVNRIQRERARINRIALKNLELYEDGKRIKITKKTIDDWNFTGLSVIDFILFKGWKGLKKVVGKESI